MTSTRYFNGGRGAGYRSVASDIKRIEIQKGGRFQNNDRHKLMLKTTQKMKRLKSMDKQKESSTERFKRLLSEKMEKSKQALEYERQGKPGRGGMLGASTHRGISKGAQDALKQMAMKKAAKEAKALRKMVLVSPKTFYNGKITQKGKIYDIADNLIGQVNTKNGKIVVQGGTIGRYKSGKSYFTNMLIQDSINRYSPYFINMRKMQAMQQGMTNTSYGVWGQTDDVINIGGHGVNRDHMGASIAMTSNDFYGSDISGPRQQIGMTAWGARSDNAWGTYADNVWGASLDNVWGGNSTDVWGGVGVGGLWGTKGYNIWNTGTGVNYLRKLTAFVAAFFGLKGKGQRGMRGGSGRGSGSSRTSSASVRAPVNTSTTRTR